MNKQMVIAAGMILIVGVACVEAFFALYRYVFNGIISAEQGMWIYSVLLIMYLLAIAYFYFVKAHKLLPQHDKRVIIERAFDNVPEKMTAHQQFVIGDDDFAKLLATALGGEVIIMTKKEFATLTRNQSVDFISTDGHSVTVELLSIRSDGTRVRRFS